MCRLRRASLWFWSKMIASLLSSQKGKTLPLELRGGSLVRVGSDTNFGDKLSDAMKDQVLLLLQLRDFHLQDSRARSRLFPAFAEDSTSCTSANALWRFLESSARSAFLPRTQGFRAFPHHTRRPQISTVS